MAEIACACNVRALLPGYSPEFRDRVQGYVSYAAEYERRALPRVTEPFG